MSKIHKTCNNSHEDDEQTIASDTAVLGILTAMLCVEKCELYNLWHYVSMDMV